jgi:branched-chain amino acid aminotransferase
MGFFASIDGVVGPAADAKVSVLDTGFTFGDAVYETLRTYGGRPFALDRHLERLRASGERLGIGLPLSDAEMAARIEAVLGQAGNEESYIRLMVTRGVGDVSYHFDRVQGPTVVVLVKPYAPLPDKAYEDGVPVVVARTRRNHPDALDPAIKCCNLLNNVLAVREAQARGAFEPLMLNAAGELAEGAGSNVFLVRAGRVLTPSLQAGILAGVTRAVVLELCRDHRIPAAEQALLVSDLRSADEAFLTSTLKEIVPIRSVDNLPVGDGHPGPFTKRLLELYRRYAKP